MQFVREMNMYKQEAMDEIGVCVLTSDRAGYGERDPNPKRVSDE